MAGVHNILNPVCLKEAAKSWLIEDCPNFDLQGIVAGEKEVIAKIYCKSKGVLAGVPFVNAVFKELDCTANWSCMEGTTIDGGSQNKIEVAHVTGKGSNVLLAERLILNILSRCSGVATRASRIKQKLIEHRWNGTIAGSRKTTPGFRMVEKYGLMVANVDPHRYDLSSMIMLKDNHVAISGSIKSAIDKVKNITSFSTKIEVECGSLEEATAAARASADIIMLDNFNPVDLQKVATEIKTTFPHILIEASGGITEDNAHHYAQTSIDIISMSSLIQGYETVDFSMKIFKN